MDEDILMEDESHRTVADIGGPVASDPSGSSGRIRPSAKLRARIEKLAHWRIKPASTIDFQDDPVSHGGHATVSKGAMNPESVGMWNLKKRALGKNIAFDGFLRKRREMTNWRGELNVAVKKMRLADNTDFERVLGLTIREAEFLAQLDHPNIVELEGFVKDVSKDIIWLVFPWTDYGNLKDFISRERWDILERISMISDVTKGLEYLHTRNPPICHGDLKSLNVLIYGDWDDELEREKIYARITDFGSARRLPQRDTNAQIEEMVTQVPSAQPPSAAFRASTQTITLTGNKYTLRWAAPELLLQDQLTLWSDIWALGWIAYEVMTESLPFEDAASEGAVVERVVKGKLPSLTDNAHLLLIHELCSLMNMCWNIQPTLRPTAGSCRRSIEQMPMFAPAVEYDERILDYDHLRQLGQMYQSRGEYASAFTSFVEALDPVKERLELEGRIQGLRDLAQLARLRGEYSETIAVYDVIWEIYEENNRKDTAGLADAFYDLAELHRLRKESEEGGELHYDRQDIQGQQRVAKVLRAMAENHRFEGNHDKAILVNTNALKISTDLGDGESRADALWGLAEAHRNRSDYEEAIQPYSEVLEIRTDLGDRKGRADALLALADIRRCRSEYDETIRLYCELLEILTDVSNKAKRTNVIWNLADVHRLRREVVPPSTKTLKFSILFRNKEGIADVLLELAEVHRLRNEYEEAIQLYSEVSEIRTDSGDRTGRADVLWDLAEVHRSRSEYEEAIQVYSEVVKIRTDLGDGEGRANALLGLADVHRRRNEYEKATQVYSEVLKIRTNFIGRADALWGLADVHRCRSDYGKAIPFYSEVLKIGTYFSHRETIADALWGLADVHRRRGEYEQAILLYSQVLEISVNFGDRKSRADALWGLADVHRSQNACDQAIPLYYEVLKIWTYFGDNRRRASVLYALAEMHRLRYEYHKARSLYHEATMLFIHFSDMAGRDAALSGLYSCGSSHVSWVLFNS